MTNRIKHGQAPGFLIVEVLIAVLIFCVVSMIVSYHVWTETVLHKEAQNRLQALSLASNQLERVLMQQRMPLSHEEYDGFTIRLQSKPLYTTRHMPLMSADLCTVHEVTVSWQSICGDEKTLTLATAYASLKEDVL